MDKHAVPCYALEKKPEPGMRETRMRPARSGNPLRCRSEQSDE